MNAFDVFTRHLPQAQERLAARREQRQREQERLAAQQARLATLLDGTFQQFAGYQGLQYAKVHDADGARWRLVRDRLMYAEAVLDGEHIRWAPCPIDATTLSRPEQRLSDADDFSHEFGVAMSERLCAL